MNKLLKIKTNLIKSNNPLSSDSSFSIEDNIIKLNMDDDKSEQKSGSVELSRIQSENSIDNILNSNIQ